jgi:hypothetical protein
MPFSIFDIGGCNCPGCSCFPCNLPESDLHINVLSQNPAGGVISNTTALLTFTAPCTWAASFTTTPPTGTTITVAMSCGASCFKYSAVFASISASLTQWFDHPLNCSGLTGQHLSLISFTCSPLNVVWQFSNVAGFTTHTLTL